MDKKTTLFILSLFVFVSCNRSISIEKRRYSKGYYVNISSRPNALQNRHRHAKNTDQVNQKCDPVVQVENLIPGKYVSGAIKYDASKNASIPAISATTKQVKIKNKKPIADPAATIKSYTETKSGVSDTEKSAVELELNKGKKITDHLFLLASGAFAFLSLYVFKRIPRSAKRLSYWAKKNPGKAKGTLAVTQTLLIAGGICGGKQLYDMGITSGDISTYALMGAAGAAAFLSPAKKVITSSCKRNYNKQKFHFFIVSMLGLLLFVNLGNRTAADRQFSQPTVMLMSSADHAKTKMESEIHPNEKDSDDRVAKMILKVILTVLSVVLMITLIGLGAYIMCELICLEEVLAGLLLGFGIQGFGIMAFIFSINAIWEKGIFKKDPVGGIVRKP